MASAKRNEDGLIGGSLVSERDHLKITTQKRTEANKEARRLAAEKVVNPTPRQAGA